MNTDTGVFLRDLKRLQIFWTTCLVGSLFLIPNWASAGRYVKESKPELVVKIPWETATYKLPLGGTEGFQRFGPRKFLVGMDGSLYFIFSRNIFKFSRHGKLLASSNNLEGGFVKDVEFNPKKGPYVLLETQKPYGVRKYSVFQFDPDLKIIKRNTLEVKDLVYGSRVQLKNGVVYHENNKGRNKIFTAVSFTDSENEVAFNNSKIYSAKELSEKGELIIKNHKSKLYAMIDVYLGEMRGYDYFRIRAVHDGKYKTMGVLVINKSGDFQYVFTPPRKTYFGEACYWVLPAVDKNGDVFYLYNDAEAIYVYRWPVRW